MNDDDREKRLRLIHLLESVEHNDTNYAVRNALVFQALGARSSCAWRPAFA
ncbi:Hypothetical protein UVM_LOCUS426 [uncultured virus]|nr:Hypothetical protein UVM_LOCUS426 [uncultured virus]